MRFGAVKAALGRAPLRTFTVPVAAFQEDWARRPVSDVAVGLKLISQLDNENARAVAAKRALELHEPDDIAGQLEAYNDAMMSLAVARATTDPNDATRPFFDLADDTVPIAMTSEGIRFVWGAIERLHIEESPIWPPATDGDLGALATRLRRGDVASLPAPIQNRVRRLLSFCLADLGGHPDEVEDEDVVSVSPPSFVGAP